MFLSNFLSQLFALLMKQAMIAKRTPVTTLSLLFVPSLFVLLAGLVANSSFQPIESQQDSNITLWTESNLGFGAPLVPCVVRGLGGNFKPDESCVAIAYAPANDAIVVSIMERLATNSNLKHYHAQGKVVQDVQDLGFIDVVGFDSEDILEQYLRRGENYGYIHAGVFFNEKGVVAPVANTLDPDYYHSFGSTDGVRNSEASIALLEPEKSTLTFRIMTNSTLGELGVTPNSKLNIQTHITQSLMAEMSKKDDARLNVKIKTYTGPKPVEQQEISFLQPRIVAPLIYIGSVGILVVVLQNAAMEKATEKFDNLRSMGLSDACYWLSWMVFYACASVFAVFPSIAAGHAIGLPLFTKTPFVLMYAVLYLNNVALVAFAILLSTFTSSSWGANMMAAFIAIGGLLVIVILFVFNRNSYINVYHPFGGAGVMLDVIHYLPVFTFPRILENMVMMTSPFRNSTPRQYTMDDFFGGAYQYTDLMQTAFGPEKTKVSEDPREVLSSRDACRKAAIIENNFQDPITNEDLAFLDQYKCITQTRDEPFRTVARKTDGYPSATEITSTPGASCLIGWSWAAGETKQLCEASNGLFISRPRQGPLNIFMGDRTQFKNFESSLEDIGDFPFVRLKKDLSRLAAGNLVQVENLEGFCACVSEMPSDATLLSRMLLIALIFPIATWYLGQVTPTNVSQGQNPLFIIAPWYWFPKRFSRPDFITKMISKVPLKHRWDETPDEDVLEEQQRVRQSIIDGNPDALIVDDIVKLYGNRLPDSQDKMMKREVNGVSLGLKQGEVFALLGHNGAGKTTLVKMLLGLLPITGGDAYVSGLSVRDKVQATRKLMSICPQHDILWENLSGPEHLLFFGLFQGLSLSEARKNTEDLIEKVMLKTVGNRPAGAYSGGMQRRLSVAISFVGNRSIVFLDEPTTGMDPQNRSHIWELITEMKKTRTVVLTTHGMDEAEQLGDRIGIMKRGCLVALGSSAHLRRKFGGIHRIEVVPKPLCDRLAFVTAAQEVAPHVEYSELEITSSSKSIKMNIPVEYVDELSLLFTFLQESVNSGKLSTWIFSGATLEDVFMKLSDEEPPLKKKKWLQNSFTNGMCSSGSAMPEGATSRDLERGFMIVLDDEEYGQRTEVKSITGKRNIVKQVLAIIFKEFWVFWGSGQNVLALTAVVLGLSISYRLNESYFREGISLGCVTECVTTNMRDCLDQDVHENMDCYGGLYEALFSATAAGYGQTLDSFEMANLRALKTSLEMEKATEFESLYRRPTAFHSMDYNIFAANCNCLGPDDSTPKFPNTNKNANWTSGQIRPFTSSPLEFSIDRILIAFESQSNTQDLIANVGSLCPNPAERAFVQPAASGNQQDIGLTCSEGTQFYSWEQNDLLRFPGESGEQDIKCLTDVYNVTSGKTNFDLAKVEHENLVSQSNGLLSKFPSKVLQQQRLANNDGQSVYYDTSPLMCPGSFYDGLEIDNESRVEDAFLGWLEKSVGELEDEQVPFPPENEASYVQMDTKTAPIALVFHDAKLVENDEAPQLEYTLYDMREFAPNGNAIASKYLKERYSDSILDEVMTGMSTAILRQVHETHQGSRMEGFNESTRVQVGSGKIGKQLQAVLNRDLDPKDVMTSVYGVTLVLLVLLSIVFPQVAHGFVKDRELRIRHLMNSMGLSSVAYYVGEFIFWMCTMGIFIMGIYGCFDFNRSTLLSMQLLQLIFLYLGMMLLFSMLFALVFKRSDTARLPLYMIVALMVLLAEVLYHVVYISWNDDERVFPRDPESLWWFLIPSNAFYFGALYAMGSSSDAHTWEVTAEVAEYAQEILLIECAVLAVVILYLDQVIASQYGTPRHWLFPLDDLLQLCGLRVPRILTCGRGGLTEKDVKGLVVVKTPKKEQIVDRDVALETMYVQEVDEAMDSAVFIRNLRMVFPGKPVPIVAVDNLNLHVNRLECFGLLGPNGAGKSTTLSILTGLYKATSGSVLIEGCSPTNTKSLQKVVGICPQMDPTWPELSVVQHLNCYARLNGSGFMEMKSVVSSVMRSMEIFSFRHKRAKDLSGGTRRRLTMAISLIRNPKVWFLDEPTTGVDVDTRRKIWSVIQREKSNRSIVLTTHSMEEAEILCDRIGIMAHGQLQALGTLDQLKKKYATGYVLQVNPVPGQIDLASEYVALLSGYILELPRTTHMLLYTVKAEFFTEVVAHMGEAGVRHGILGYDLRPTTLEDVFIKVAGESERVHGVA